MFFKDIIGNDKQKEYLNQAIENKKVLHSYLFVGATGIGKKIIAKEFARKILCFENGLDTCNCKSCICFNGNSHPDFSILNEQDDTIKVDEIRELIKKVYEKPIISNKKVYIINEADKMTQEAQNSLLKTLEEPPEFTTILLITSNENAILNTIKSRSLKVVFDNLNDDVLKEYLEVKLGFNNISDNMLKAFAGSIGTASKLYQNIELYTKIEQFVNKISSLNQIQLLKQGKVLYEKDIIKDVLDYFVVCLYSNGTKDIRYLNCIDYVVEALEHFKYNSNFDMTLDNMLIKIAEEFSVN
jgi:DNA polymerase-3 subunit delta'